VDPLSLRERGQAQARDVTCVQTKHLLSLRERVRERG